MSSKKMNVTDRFEVKECGLCGSSALSQFFGINDNFIEYSEMYFPFKHLLTECLNLHISKANENCMEICFDCKSNLVRFYHFKRKIKEAQEFIQKRDKKRAKPINTEDHSKIVYKIYSIIEDYTESCSISSISVNKSDRKLIITATDDHIDTLKYAQLEEENNDDKNDKLPIIKNEIIQDSNYVNDPWCQDFEDENYDESAELNASSSFRESPDRTGPPRKRPKRERPKKLRESEYDIGSLNLSVIDVINAFNAEANKFADKYGDVFRKLMLEKYQTKIVVNFSFIGKSNVRVTTRCERCKETYKIEGSRDDFINKVPTRCAVWSSRMDFCRCSSELCT